MRLFPKDLLKADGNCALLHTVKFKVTIQQQISLDLLLQANHINLSWKSEARHYRTQRMNGTEMDTHVLVQDAFTLYALKGDLNLKAPNGRRCEHDG